MKSINKQMEDIIINNILRTPLIYNRYVGESGHDLYHHIDDGILRYVERFSYKKQASDIQLALIDIFSDLEVLNE